MRVYNVSYDLKKVGQDYSGLISELKRSSSWWHYLGSTWLIATDESAQQLWNRISSFVDQNDSVLVMEVVGNYAGWLPQEAWEWIYSHVQRRAA